VQPEAIAVQVREREAARRDAEFLVFDALFDLARSRWWRSTAAASPGRSVRMKL
jgi:hypothetical protein